MIDLEPGMLVMYVWPPDITSIGIGIGIVTSVASLYGIFEVAHVFHGCLHLQWYWLDDQHKRWSIIV